MRFTCSREKLLGGLQIVGSVVSTRGMKPVYESVLIRSRDGALEMMGTDLEVAIRFHLTDEDGGIRIEEAGALVVPAAKLTAILREVKDDKVDFTWENNILTIECVGSRFRMNGLPEDEFPEIPDFPEQAPITVPSALFQRMVARTSFAAAREKMRYALNGVLLLLKDNRLTMVGTDGRRLAHSGATLDDPTGSTAEADLRAIVPTKGMTQISKVVGEEEETIDLALGNNQLSARTEHAVVVSRVLEGSFPPFEDVIPVNCERRARVKRDDLVAAVRKAALLTNKESQSVRWTFAEGSLTLTARAAEVGEAHVSLDIEYEGEPAEVAFNPAYVLDGLAVIEDETVTFEFRNPSSPAKMTDGDEFTYVVMPISIE
ncbi:MAG: DNA polymerase III subunit beta [Planctomycetota bacterium]